MEVVGRACLLLALAVSVYGAGASLYGARRGRRAWVDSGRRAVYAVAGLLVIAFAILELAFLRSDFSLQLVSGHSSTTTPAFYRATAIWSSQEGSLLLWVLLLSLWSAAALAAVRRRAREVVPYATAVLLGLAAFFCALLVLLESPFAVNAVVPAEGGGLNPLLRHPSMMIHPPMLYAGYTLFAIPFAFAVGALAARRLNSDWLRLTRPFTLAAWTFLGTGILLGARWSYSELGWGGYWAWDPVENASLLPWLTGTAFLHSAMVQERRGMLKVWNVSLVLATGILCILGTFLVRSGILESIHAFGASTLGVPFLVLIAVMTAGAVALVVSRAAALRSEHRLDSWLSREAIFLGNNLVLVALAFVVFWGTFFPLISEAVTGTAASVGPPWFDQYIVPLSLVLVLLSGLGPVVAWRRGSWAQLRRVLALPAALGVGCALLLLPFGAGARPLALAMFALGAFVVGVVGQELWRGVRARRAMAGESPPLALVRLIGRNRRRYGGYLVHAGIAVLFVGVAASSAFQDEVETRLAVGETARAGGYDFEYVRATTRLENEKLSFGAELVVRRDGEFVARLFPERGFYRAATDETGTISRFFQGEATSEVGLAAGLRRDVWTAVSPDLLALEPLIREADRRFENARGEVQAVVLTALADRYTAQPPDALFRLIVSPLVSWIWIGALIAIGGAGIALWPSRRRAPKPVAARYKARVAAELTRV